MLAALLGLRSGASLVRMAARVLIVDDSEEFLDAATALLEREGLVVAGVASTTAAALAEAEKLRPEVILVDVSLGTESGFCLAGLLDEDDRVNGATVILISTHSEADLEELIAASPASGFVSKTELSANRIRRILAAGRG